VIRTRHLLIVVLALALVSLEACGGKSSDEKKQDPVAAYEQGYRPAVRAMKAISKDTGDAVVDAKNHTDAELVTQFRGLATRWQSQLSRLEILKPTSALAADHKTLTTAATRVESDLHAIVTAAATHDADAARQASASLVTDILDTKAASAQVDKRLRASARK
jgi:hypothetical protein